LTELTTTYYKLIDTVTNFKLPTIKDVEEVHSSMKKAKRILTVGVGRSGDNADILAKFLRNLGYREVYGPEDIPFMFERHDLLIAISGSGTTTYTFETARVASEAGSKVVVITSDPKAPILRYATKALMIPGRSKIGHNSDYFGKQIMGHVYAPLTPLGTLFELRTLLLIMSFIGHEIGKGFEATYNEIVGGLKAFKPQDESFYKFYSLLPKPRSDKNPFSGKTVAVGEGLSGIVARFFITRLRHCAKKGEDRECYYWMDRGSISVRGRDLILVISGSGEYIPAVLAKKAKDKGAKVVGITSYEDSTLGKIADLRVIVPGRIKTLIKGLRSSYFPRDPIMSIFEVRTLFLLESMIYLIAEREGITEEDMKGLHSDFT
jgi:6-phospho-3-hexuloisomerase